MKIIEDYCSFEVAKLLKEKGFDEKCQKVYMHNGQLLLASIFMEGESFVDNECIEDVANYNDWITYTQGEYAYLCPTLQMACKWLREVYNVVIEINSIWIVGFGYNYIARIVVEGESKKCLKHYNSYEEAVEAALKYCLENLV